MFGFYHSLGLIGAFAGTMLIQTTNPGYVEPIVPRYLDSVLLTPIEESLFFGIPLVRFSEWKCNSGWRISLDLPSSH